MYMNIVYCLAKALFAMVTSCEIYYFSAFMTDCPPGSWPWCCP